MNWSTVFLDSIFPNASDVPLSLRLLDGPMPFRNAELAPRCTDEPHGAFILLTVTSWSRNGSSGSITGLNSKPVPSFSGCHVSGHTPHGKYTAPNRNGDAGAADKAGIMASRKGSATVAPKVPRMKVRRER